MTSEQIERLRLFVAGHKRRSVLSASNARENGYKQIALEHENETRLAEIILKDLEEEYGEENARQEADY